MLYTVLYCILAVGSWRRGKVGHKTETQDVTCRHGGLPKKIANTIKYYIFV